MTKMTSSFRNILSYTMGVCLRLRIIKFCRLDAKMTPLGKPLNYLAFSLLTLVCCSLNSFKIQGFYTNCLLTGSDMCTCACTFGISDSMSSYERAHHFLYVDSKLFDSIYFLSF